MAEQFANNAASTLSAGIDNIVTSLTVANGTVFPASGNFRIIIDSELILVGARSGNTLSSLTRGVEGTTAASHSSGAAVTHVLTQTGLVNYISDRAILQAIVDAKGDLIVATAADIVARLAVGANDTLLIADSSQATGLRWGGAWASYTPAWTSSGTAPAIGNGTLSGLYAQLGKLVFGKIFFQAGSTTTFGTGTYAFSLPVAASAGETGNLGTGEVNDATPANAYENFVRLASTTTFDLRSPAAPTVVVGATAPITFAVNDLILARFFYQAA